MKSRTCASCGAPGTARFRNRTLLVSHRGHSIDVRGLGGWRCSSCGEIEFDPKSAQHYAAAGDKLVLRVRALERSEIRRIRLKLGLSQVTAAKLTGGGHNAFSRYERGETVAMPAVVNLFRLLDKHPALLKELRPSE